jgi:hypothetical protein
VSTDPLQRVRNRSPRAVGCLRRPAGYRPCDGLTPVVPLIDDPTLEASMDQTPADATSGMQMQDGDDFVCPNCDCEIMLKHHGDPARMPTMQPFTCCCGTQMQPEHPTGSRT